MKIRWVGTNVMRIGGEANMVKMLGENFSRGNVQNSLAKELYIVSYTTFETIKETSISSFRNSRLILELESKRLAGRV